MSGRRNMLQPNPGQSKGLHLKYGEAYFDCGSVDSYSRANQHSRTMIHPQERKDNIMNNLL